MKAIMARASNGIIGCHGKLPWRIPAELRFFRDQTAGGIVLMGRKTFESMDCKPLPGRENWILSRTGNWDGVKVFRSPAEVFMQKKWNSAWVIGGVQLFDTFMPYITRFVISEVRGDYDGDTYYSLVGDEWRRRECLASCAEFTAWSYELDGSDALAEAIA